MLQLSSLLREPAEVLGTAAVRMIAVLIGLCCHEWGHAYVAYRCGDDTAKQMGRMTLNPIAHLDPVGTLLMLFAGFGYAKPVPVNPYKFKGDRVRCDLLVSLAGITVNLILFVIFTYVTVLLSSFFWKPEVVADNGLSILVDYRYNAIWAIIEGIAVSKFGVAVANPFLAPFLRVTAYTALINLNLAVFNLIPIPPLDGYHVVNDIVFKGRIQLDRRAFQIAMLIVMILAWQGVLGRVISFVVYPVQRLILMPLGA